MLKVRKGRRIRSAEESRRWQRRTDPDGRRAMKKEERNR